jgi:hypothetical protein
LSPSSQPTKSPKDRVNKLKQRLKGSLKERARVLRGERGGVFM